jgi:hypothetical protein
VLADLGSQQAAAPPKPDLPAAERGAGPAEPQQRPTGSVALRPDPDDGRLTGPVVRRPDSQIERRAAAPVAQQPAPDVVPSWGKVAGTTVQLWLSRRRTRWRVAAAIVVALIVFAGGALTVALLRNTTAAGVARGGRTSAAPPVSGLGPVQAAEVARQQAAAWVATQVSHSAVVSCDPDMCAALQTYGFPAGDLMTLGPAASDPLGSAVIVATAAVRSAFGSRLTSVYAPTVIASFGSGSAQVDVRVYAAGGAAQYLAALRADEQSRQRVGRQLLHNSRVSAAPAAAAQLAAGEVDSRLLSTIATLSGQGLVSIVAFDDSGPGASAGAPLRLAELASPPRAKSGYLQSTLAFLRAQQAPYLASNLTLARLANGQEVVRIEFAAPSPLGLLGG